MSRKLSEMSLSTLRKMFRETLRAAGKDSVSARLIGRAISAKLAAQRAARKGMGRRPRSNKRRPRK
jgi:hypothetical protein